MEHGGEDGDDSKLLARLVHDLRNPLGVIAYFADTLPAAAEIERPELCERLQINARRALQVVEEFTLLADLRHGRAVPDDAEVDGVGLLAELVTEIEALERRAGCIRTVAAERARVRGDRTQLACAVRGILREAVRSSASGSVQARLTDEDACAVLTALMTGPWPSSWRAE
jgi:signal transduction histidine kinase